MARPSMRWTLDSAACKSPELREAACEPEMDTQGGEGMGWRQLEGSAEKEER